MVGSLASMLSMLLACGGSDDADTGADEGTATGDAADDGADDGATNTADDTDPGGGTTAGSAGGTGSDDASADTTAGVMCEYVDIGREGCPEGTVQCMEQGPSYNCSPAETADVCCVPCTPPECPG